MANESCLPAVPPYSLSDPFHTFTMPTSKSSIRQRDAQLRAQLSRELTLATLKEPNSWNPSWKTLLLVYTILKQYPLLDSLHDHPYLYDLWWSHESATTPDEVSMKMVLSNEDGTSVVLIGTSVCDKEDARATCWVFPSYLALSHMESEVSLQLHRFFQDNLTLFEGIRIRSIVLSSWDDSLKDAYDYGVRELQKSWLRGTALVF